MRPPEANGSSRAPDTPAERPVPLVVIPARLRSGRLPRKALLDLGGRALVVHSWQRAVDALPEARIIVATDAPEIARAAEDAGALVEMTSRSCRSGTDRVAEVSRRHPHHRFVLNVQGDEPFADPLAMQGVLDALWRGGCAMATAACPWPPDRDPSDPAAVKVVLDHQDRALYFSRAPIPHAREPAPGAGQGSDSARWLHLGIYGFERSFLLRFASWPEGALERVEGLEQLRALEHGHPIAVARVERPGFGGVDTQDDLERARRRWAAQGARG